MSKLIAITNQILCDKALDLKVQKLCEAGIWAIVLRQKELSEDRYCSLFLEISQICAKFKTELFLHNFIDTARKFKHPNLWLPLPVLRKNSTNLSNFDKIVASVHNLPEAKEALNLGANTLCLSHIFPTFCKLNSQPKGIGLIRDIREFFGGEIYALGGINERNFKDVLGAGADKMVVMSEAMKCMDEGEFVAKFH